MGIPNTTSTNKESMSCFFKFDEPIDHVKSTIQHNQQRDGQT